MHDSVDFLVSPLSGLTLQCFCKLPLLVVLVIEVLVDIVAFLGVLGLLGEFEGELLAGLADGPLLLVGVYRALGLFQWLPATEVGAAGQVRVCLLFMFSQDDSVLASLVEGALLNDLCGRIQPRHHCLGVLLRAHAALDIG